ncbi:MAG TPA: UDP-glucose/GDP-mannose dehydrogenase family protein [Acidiferrobacteraceae bacterium]|nr:UDP-glucose/GDP-mannose dehydrogenase family protein [Acidiferrobacteraceae bacterium]
MNVTVIGTGYVGLVTGTCLAEVGNHVVCVDTDENKIKRLLDGQIPIFEPGLEALVHQNVEAGRLTFTTDLARGVVNGEVLMIAVGTPPDEDGSADLKHVLAVAKGIGEVIDSYRVVVTKSTVPVGTADKVNAEIESELKRRDVEVPYSVVSNPEFLKEGAAIEDFMKPDRIVVGANDNRAVEVMRELYAPFNRNHERVIFMDIRSSEMTKYAANSLLATKISFMNEMANLAERLGADIENIRRGIGADPRIGYHFIYPGCGYGGSCFPKDVQALYRTAQQNGYDARILSAVEKVNYDQKKVLLEKVVRHFGDDLSGLQFTVWGLSFKPDTDDMREAPSRVIMEGLWERGATVHVHDPVSMDEVARIYGERKDLCYHRDPYEALRESDGLFVVTEWKVFRSPNIAQIEQNMKNKVIFDGRNIFNPQNFKDAGFTYYGIGR